jgi:indole-3-glycerol phosphate synthase
MKGVRDTATILDKIVARKVEEVAAARARRLPRSCGLPEDDAPPARRDPVAATAVAATAVAATAVAATSVAGSRPGFAAALRDRRPGRPIIAEIKKASPSAGVLREPFDPVAIARAYTQAGARCLSVITDEKFFQGSLDVLRQVRAVTALPLLRKDFIIDAVQLEEAVEAGADAVLLIARILDDALLADLYAAAIALGLETLLEVHDAADLERALALSPRPQLIGVNNRDLADFTVSLRRTLDLLPLLPPGVTLVSESGLSDPADLDRLLAAGVHAFLVGTALMKAEDPGAALRRLVEI